MNFSMQNQDASKDKKLDKFCNPNHAEHPDNRAGPSGDKTPENTATQVS